MEEEIGKLYLPDRRIRGRHKPLKPGMKEGTSLTLQKWKRIINGILYNFMLIN